VPWFQVDDDLPTHPDMLATSLAARGLWVTAGAWSSKRLTDVVPDHVLASLGGTPELAKELGARGVWKRVRGGWRFTQSGLCKIPVKEAIERERKNGAARQRRWQGAQHNAVSNAVSNGVRDGVPIPVPKEPPNPPPSGGHDGSHPNCRACGTNRRGPPPEPAATPIPPPFEQVHHVNGTPATDRAVRAIAAQARKAITRENHD
jgi:hypothetical protein